MRRDNKAPVFGVVALVVAITACSSSNGSTVTGAQNTSSGGALQITGQPTTQINAGDSYYFNAGSTGGVGTTRAFAISNKPSWISFNTLTGEMKGATSTAGTYSNIWISVSDGTSKSVLPSFSIQVIATTGKVQLSWASPSLNTDGTQLNDLSGYAIHYGTSATSLTQRIAIGSPNTLSYTLSNLAKGHTYYFTVSAVNALNLEGEASTVMSVTI